MLWWWQSRAVVDGVHGKKWWMVDEGNEKEAWVTVLDRVCSLGGGRENLREGKALDG